MTPDEVLEIARGFQPASVVAAAADLDLFGALCPTPLSAAELARVLEADVRGIRILLDALVALGLLEKTENRFSVPEDLVPTLGRHGAGSVLAMAQHLSNCLRRWAHLARVVKSGRPTERVPSIRGEAADDAAFIRAMDNICAPLADGLVAELKPLEFRHLLDVGGASGTWTVAFLRAAPGSRATLFDLPHVIPMAERYLEQARMIDRVRLASGDFMADPLPPGADLAWVSAIVHQNSRAQNRALFAKVSEALVGGGRVLIRDILMDPDRTSPAGGALFAVNMLVATEGGGTFTFDELREDLETAGFVDASLLKRDTWMNSVVSARKPG